jgi:hypothetical protein
MSGAAITPRVKFLVAISDPDPNRAKVVQIIEDVAHQFGFHQPDDYIIVRAYSLNDLRQHTGADALTQNRFMLIATPRLGPNADSTLFDLRSAARSQLGKAVLLDLDSSGQYADPPIITIEGWEQPAQEQLREVIYQFLHNFVTGGLQEYHYYAHELDRYKRIYLSPLLPAAKSMTAEEVIREWNTLGERIVIAAEKQFERGQQHRGDERKGNLVEAHALLRLHLEATIFAERARTNYLSYEKAQRAFRSDTTRSPLKYIPPGFGISSRNEYSGIVGKVRRSVRHYIGAMRKWDRALGWRHHFFRRQFGDAEFLNELSRDISTPYIMSDPYITAASEPGWVVLAQQVRRELRYHARDQLLHELWLDRRLISAALFFGIWLLAGYGLRPVKVIFSVLLIPLFFAFAFFLDDTKSGCVAAGSNPLVYFFISITTLATLGSQVSNLPCGRFTGLLVSLEAITGFFLLATVATLFVEIFFSRDR